MGQIVEQYPWSELVIGCYVYDATGNPWKLTDEHPQQPGTFRAVDAEGKIAILNNPGKPVRALVPDEDEALHALAEILGARSMEPHLTVEALPLAGPGAAAKVRSHLKLMHAEYSEPSMRLPKLLAQHNAAHANGRFYLPHTHKDQPWPMPL